MSKNWYEWRRALWDAEDVGRGELLVGMYIWDCANEHREAWPTVSKIARKTRYTRRQAQRIIDDLVAKGWVSKRAWELPSGGESWRYTLRMPSNEHAKKVWGLVLNEIKPLMSTRNYESWLEPIRGKMEAPDAPELCLICPDEFAAMWVESNYRALIEECAAKHGIKTVSFTFDSRGQG